MEQVFANARSGRAAPAAASMGKGEPDVGLLQAYFEHRWPQNVGVELTIASLQLSGSKIF
jgi:hypothetical protein